MKLGPEDVSLLERCPHFRGCYVQDSMELGPEDVSILERCPHFRGCYVQASMNIPSLDPAFSEESPHWRTGREGGEGGRTVREWVKHTASISRVAIRAYD